MRGIITSIVVKNDVHFLRFACQAFTSSRHFLDFVVGIIITKPLGYRFAFEIGGGIAPVQTQIGNVRIGDRVNLTGHNGKMLLRGRVHVYENGPTLAKKPKRLVKLVALEPIAVS